jgi:hypothetical protein
MDADLLKGRKKTFCSNPLKSISGGQFSPIPKRLLNQMAHLNLNKTGTNNSPQSRSPSTGSTHFTKHYQHQAPTASMVLYPGHQTIKTALHQQNSSQEELNNLKRKLDTTGLVDNSASYTQTQEIGLAGLINKASQQP